jgi:hypothetical protein
MHAVDRKQQLQTWLESSIDASPIVLEPPPRTQVFVAIFVYVPARIADCDGCAA